MLTTMISDHNQHQYPSIMRPDSMDAERAARLARALAPTVYCPEARVDECVASSPALPTPEASIR
jgi:hypothetical protein